MGSLGFNGEVESHPGISNCKKYKLPKTLLVGCDGGSHASVPRKLRSAIKKRAEESMTSPLSISKKRPVSNKANTLKKDGGKKPKAKRGHITKDEEEVAETLYALASMFTETNKANRPGSGHEPASLKLLNDQETGVLTDAVENTGIWTQRKESMKTSSKVNLDEPCRSPILSRSKGKLKKTDLSTIVGVESNLLVPPRPRVSKEQLIDLEQKTASGYQYAKKYYPTNDNSSFQCTQNTFQFDKSWKRSSTHVHISRLIKVLQFSENKEGSSKNLTTQLSTSGGAHEMTGLNSRESFSGTIHSAVKKGPAEIEHDVFFNKNFIQDRQLALETSALHSAKEGFYDFLSLDTEICIHEGRKQFSAPHLPQLQIHSDIPFSLSQNGYSSTFHGQSLALTAQKAQPRQQWPHRFNSGRVGPANLLDWENGNTGPPSTANCAQALLPRFPSPTSSSLPLQNGKMNHRPYQKLGKHRFPLGFFGRNGTTVCSDNVQKLQFH